MTGPVLSRRALNRTLLRRQLLLEPSPMPPLEAVRHLVGLQAQLPSNPYLALRARLAAFEPSDLEALLEAREVVRMVLMRGTIHLVTTDDALALRPVIQPVLDRELFGNRTWATGLEGVDLAPVLARAADLLDERPRTLAELRVELAASGLGDHPAIAYAARNRLPTIQALPRGLWTRTGAPRLTTLDRHAGRPVGSDSAPAPLIRRALAAYGPATVADLQQFTGLQGLRAGVEAMRDGLRTFRDERGRELFDLPDAPLATGDEPAPVRFLPDYDNALLAHDDRSRIVPAGLPWPALGDNVTAPVYLVDGFVAGVWRVAKPSRARDAGELALHPMMRLAAPVAAAVEAEAARLATFVATADPRRPVPVVRWAADPTTRPADGSG